MIYPLPYNLTVFRILTLYRDTTQPLVLRRYVIRKTFQELLQLFLHVDLKSQLQAIKEAIHKKYHIDISEEVRLEEIPDEFIIKELPVLIGTLYELDIVTMLQIHQLNPLFNNTFGNYVNMSDGSKMKAFDIVVSSLKDNQLYAFDVKHATIWRKSLQQDKIYLTNTSFSSVKINEVFSRYVVEAEKMYNCSVNSYLLFVCYDLLENSLSGFYEDDMLHSYHDYFKKVFNGERCDNLEKACFVINLKQLCKQVDGEYVFNRNTPNILSLEDEVLFSNSKQIYHNKFAIDITSSACIRLDNFIQQYLVTR